MSFISLNQVELAMQYDYEICGYAEIEQDGKLSLYMVNRGRSKQDRDPASCDVGRSYPMIWHTHPNVSKVYPSLVDVLKVLKHSIKRSYIFTPYGYWLLECPNKYNWIIGVPRGYNENNMGYNTDALTLEVKEFLDEFYRRSNRG